jgi:hypothetical protein
MDDQDLESETKARKNPDLQKWASDVCQKNTVLEARNKTAHDKSKRSRLNLVCCLKAQDP